MNLARIDHWRLDATTTEVDPVTGWLTMEGTAALVGVMDYGSHSEFVPRETLADVESLLAAPLTVQHPPKNLDLETTSQYQVGTVLSAKLDGDNLRVKIRVTDAKAVAAIQSGTRELSPGYQVEIDRKPGHWSGKKYDAIQRKRRYNHLALVDVARGGRQARLDSWRADGALIQRIDAMETVTIEGKEFQVPPEVAAIVYSWQAENAPAEDEAGGEAPAASAPAAAPAQKMDAADVAKRAAAMVIDAMRADRAAERRDAAELGEVVAIVRPLLPQSYRVDGKSVVDLVADAIVAKRPGLTGQVKAHRTDSGRLRGMLDMILADSTPPVETQPDGRADAAAPGAGNDPVTAAKERQRMKLLAGGQATEGKAAQ